MKRIISVFLIAIELFSPLNIRINNITQSESVLSSSKETVINEGHQYVVYFSDSVLASSNEEVEEVLDHFREKITQIVFRQDEKDGYFAVGYCISSPMKRTDLTIDLKQRMIEYNHWLEEVN